MENVKDFVAFVSLDEYGGRQGLIPISEIATGWIKYIRDHIREGQKTVCKVLAVDRERGHIDLSLKQVNDNQKREKIQEWKNEKKADKLLEIVGTKVGKSLDDAYDTVGEKLIEEYGTLYNAFEQVNANPESMKDLGIDKKWSAAITEVAGENIQIPQVTVDGILELICPGPDGVDHIKKAIASGLDGGEIDISVHYVGAPRYRVSVVAEDYKTAEQELKEAVKAMSSAVEKAGGSANFKRKEEK